MAEETLTLDNEVAVSTTDKKRSYNLDKFLKIFFIASMAGLGVWVIMGIILGCVQRNTDIPILHVFSGYIPFSDFAETLSYAICPNPYTGEYGIWTIYPPLSFLIFYPFTWICAPALKSYVDGQISLEQLSANASFIVSFVLFYLISLAIIMYVVARWTKLKGRNLIYVLGITFAFGPLLFEFIRANNTLLLFVLSLLFFYLNQSEKRWKREVSYVCLAGAICMKIYPALMIFYLVYKEKKLEKLWSVLKTLAYALFLIFVPFVLIEGGFSNISALWNNFRGFTGPNEAAAQSLEGLAGAIESLGPTQWTTNISIETVVFWFCRGLSAIFGGADLSILHTLLSSVMRYGLLLLAVVLPFVSFKSTKYKEFVTLAVGSYLLFPGVCNGYCMMLMMIPFVLTVSDWSNLSFKEKIFYSVCYFIIANPFFFSFGVFVPSSVATIVIVVKSVVDIIKSDVRILKEWKLNKANKTADEPHAETAEQA